MKSHTKSGRSRTISRNVARGRRAVAEAIEPRIFLSSYALTDLADFSTSGNAGFRPQAGLIMDSHGNLFGTTNVGGGGSNAGTVFEVVAGGTSITTLAIFGPSTGQHPSSDLVMDSSGNLYGTTQFGGTGDFGTIFELPSGSSTINTLASFSNAAGFRPNAGLIMDSSGNFYGTALFGGANSDGAVYELAAGSSTITSLAAFNSSTGYHPLGDLVADSSGNLYGTTFFGGANDAGSVFRLAAGASTITTLASFSSSTGANPEAGLVFDSNGNLYGTASEGGANSDGTVFELAAGQSTISVVASLDSSTGTNPLDTLIIDSSGNLYGTAENGGDNDFGAVFEVPAGSSTITTLASLSANTGEYPISGLIMDSSGDLLGTTQYGGANGVGTVFELTPPKAVIASQPTTVTAGTTQAITVDLDANGQLDASNQSNVTLSIATGPNGASLGGTLTVQAVNGVATFSDLAFNTAGSYTLAASATGFASGTTSTITVNPNAASQLAFVLQPGNVFSTQSLGTVSVNVEDAYGNTVITDSSMVTVATNNGVTLSGTTSVAAVNGVATFANLSIAAPGSYALVASDGGLNSPQSGGFTISAVGYQTVKLADFDGTNGRTSQAGLIIDSAGDLFGTASFGGANNDGTVFEIRAGSSSITVLASFNGANGNGPDDSLVMDSSGNLYGDAYGGGAHNDGTVFELAAGASTLTTLASFNGTNGENPLAALVMDSSGNLYGSTIFGGQNNNGTLFEVAAGSSSITVIAPYTSFLGSFGDLLLDSSGDIYGQAFNGGDNGLGSIFEVVAGASVMTTLASFDTSTGYQPRSGMAMDSSGNLFGLAYTGGPNNFGTVFELAAGSSTISVVAAFNSADGAYPQQNGLVIDSSGNLFGSAYEGGPGGGGSVFEILAGTSTIFDIQNFDPTSGFNPLDDRVALDSSDNAYVTNVSAGSNGVGSVVEFVAPPAATHTVITLQPTTVTAGDQQNIVANIASASGVVVDNPSTITLAIATGPAGATLGGTLSVMDTNGIADFSDITFTKPGTYTLTASAPGLPSAASTTITVNTASANKLDFVQSPTGNIAAGQPLGTVVVDVEDAYGNLITTDSSTVNISGPGITGTTSVTAVNGVATFTDLTMTAAGVQTLSASDNGLNPGTSASFTITPLAAVKLGFAQQPMSNMSGQSIGTVVVNVQDMYGNTVINNSTVILATSDNMPLRGTTSVQAVNGVATFTGLSIVPLGTRTLSATDGSFTTASSDSFTIAPLAFATTKLADFTTANGTSQAGLLVDSNGNLFGTTANGGLNNDGAIFEIAAGSSSITILASFNGANGSNPTASLIMDSGGNLYGTAQDGGDNNAGDVFELAAGASTITTIASFNGTNGANPVPAVIMDSSGDLFGTTGAGGDNNEGTLYEIAAGSSTITAITSFDSVYGSFSDLLMDSGGDLYGVAWNGGDNSLGSIFELPAGGSTLTTLASFDNTTGFQPRNSMAMDSSGNLYAMSYNGAANGFGAIVELPAGSNTLQVIAPFFGGNSGFPAYAQEDGLRIDSQGDLFGTVYQGGPNGNGAIIEIPAGTTNIVQLTSLSAYTGANPLDDTVAVDSSGNMYATTINGGANGMGTVFEVSPPPPATQAVITSQPNTATTGQAATFSASIASAGGLILDSSATITLSIASGPNGATLGGTLSTADTNGVATFSNITFSKPGVYSLTASSNGLTSTTSTTITVTPAGGTPVPTKLAVIQQPAATTAAGQSIGTVTVAIEDADGNVVASDNSTVTLSTNITLSGTLIVQAVNGVATFSGLSTTQPGNYMLSATDASLASATTHSFAITPAAAALLVIVQQPAANAVAGQMIGTVAVAIEDAYGNTVTSDHSTVSLATTAAPGAITAVQAVNGVATFTNLSISQAGNYTLSASDGGLASVTTGSIAIAPGAAAKLAIAQEPSSTAAAGQSIGTVTVDVEDIYGNLVTTDQSNVTILAQSSGSSTAAVLSGTATVAANNGVAVFSDLAIAAPGSYTLNAADAFLTPATTTPITIATIAGQTVTPIVVNPSTAFPMSSLNSKHLKVQVQSESSGGGVVLTKMIPVKHGSAVFNNLNLHKAGVYNVVISDAFGHTMTQQITIAAAAPARLEFVGKVTAVNGQAAASIRVTDAYGNLTTADDGATVDLYVAPPPTPGVDPILRNPIAATLVNGVATFSDVPLTGIHRGTLIAISGSLPRARSNVFKNS